MDQNSVGSSFLAGVAIVYFGIVIALVAFFIWLYWRIFEKAGYSGALSLINLFPGVGNLACMIILAFGQWPIHQQMVINNAGPIPPSPPYPPSSPPPPPPPNPSSELPA